MLSKFKNIFNSSEKKVVLYNYISLVSIQGINYILPLLTFPYIVRVVGVEKFGLLSFVSNIILYFIVITDYGFNLTATKQISAHKNNKSKLNEIVSSVYQIKILLAIISLFVLILLILFYPKISREWVVYLFSFGMVIGQVFLPIWFFQGVEKMKFLTILNVISKGLFTISIFLFIKEPTDYLLIPLLTSLGSILAGILSIIIIYKKFGIRFKLQEINVLKEQLKDSWYIFISRVAVLLYTSGNIFFLGIMTSDFQVGLYSISEKIIAALIPISTALTTAFFPYFSRLWLQNKQHYYNVFVNFTKYYIPLLLLASAILFLTAPYLIYIVSGKNISESTQILKILAITALLIPIGAMFTESFVIQDLNKYVTKATVYTSVFNLIIIFPFIHYFGIYGLAFTVLLVQIFQVMINLYYYKLNKTHLCAD